MEDYLKPKFYVFLDIDGTLWDYADLKRRRSFYFDLNPKSLDALHTLIHSLKRYFEVDLVITSKRRCFWDSCRNFLLCQGLDYEIENLHRTQVTALKHPRGVKIAEYLYNDLRGISYEEEKVFSKLTWPIVAPFINRKMKEFYVVIDDQTKNLFPFVPKDNVIQTRMSNRSLDMEMVANFLAKRNIPLSTYTRRILPSAERRK